MIHDGRCDCYECEADRHKGERFVESIAAAIGLVVILVVLLLI